MKTKRREMPWTRKLAFGFATIILSGAFCLTLPLAAKSGQGMAFVDALFTATSATCVTGLVVADTYQQFTIFGQVVILSLIQIGGLGFMTIGVYVSVLLKRKIGLKEREALHESVNTMEVGGVVRLAKRIVQGTIGIELIGACLLAIRFVPQKGVIKGIYYSVFHAVSAFCNAGFDLMGDTEAYSSFTAYEGDVLVNLTIMALIVIGGIGFIVWDDIYRNRLHIKRYLLHTKLVLVTTAVLILVATGFFLIFEHNGLFTGMTAREQVLGAMFSAITPRTAGFNSVDTAGLSNASKLLTIILMFIGGSPGSTAGGIKTTTFVVMALSAIATVRHSYGTNVCGRRLEEDAIKKASTVVVINLVSAISVAMAILAMQNFEFEDVLFEVFSAIGTTGMTTGITRDLNVISKLLIIMLMYCGRLGSLTFALTFAQKKVVPPVQLPAEKVIVG